MNTEGWSKIRLRIVQLRAQLNLKDLRSSVVQLLSQTQKFCRFSSGSGLRFRQTFLR